MFNREQRAGSDGLINRAPITWGMIVGGGGGLWMGFVYHGGNGVMGVGRDGMGCVVGWGNSDAFHCTVGRLMLWCDWADIFMNVNLVCDLTK